MPKQHLITYGAIDGKYGNPLWHTFFLLSVAEPGKPIEVIDTWSYYGPKSSEHNWLQKQFNKVKKVVKMDVDFRGNHGMLVHEKARWLDRGDGAIHGVTFQVSEEDFNRLEERCQKFAKAQNDAIDEAALALGLKVDPDYPYRIYPLEKYSRQIYDYEKAQAEKEGRSSRLQPFEFWLSMTLGGLSLRHSYVCKSGVLAMLETVLTEPQIKRLTENNNHPTIPRYSGALENLYLYSEGPLNWNKHEKQYFRKLDTPGVKLYWTLPPQEIEMHGRQNENLLKISSTYRADAKAIINQLQRLEWLFINANVGELLKEKKEKLLERIREHYKAFSIVPEKPRNNAPKTSWTDYALSIFSLPRDQDEAELLKHIKRGKALVNSLYFASTLSDINIDDNASSFELSAEEQRALAPYLADDHEISYLHPLDVMASYLNPNDKKELCEIAGRSYQHPDSLNGYYFEEVWKVEANIQPKLCGHF